LFVQIYFLTSSIPLNSNNVVLSILQVQIVAFIPDAAVGLGLSPSPSSSGYSMLHLSLRWWCDVGGKGDGDWSGVDGGDGIEYASAAAHFVIAICRNPDNSLNPCRRHCLFHAGKAVSKPLARRILLFLSPLCRINQRAG